MNEMLFDVYSKAIYAANRADINGDGTYNAVDFSLAKRMYLESVG